MKSAQYCQSCLFIDQATMFADYNYFQLCLLYCINIYLFFFFVVRMRHPPRDEDAMDEDAKDWLVELLGCDVTMNKLIQM